ncbi:membrane cofactor protein-like [Gracilinanus agilis]|uniref:membrane cofactor protein-like n=1 Tax=Gracilinanus agilis TaxID=191870 RepID=UPI001CFE3FE2|nr:membrane cofactor protein-like [Gracilinanus agilis]
MKDGIWSDPAPTCKVVRCETPLLPDGHIQSLRRPSYTYKETVILECNPGFYMIGKEMISCDADDNWIPGIPQCKEGVKPTTVGPTVATTITTSSSFIGGTSSSANKKENQLITIFLVTTLVIFSQSFRSWL